MEMIFKTENLEEFYDSELYKEASNTKNYEYEIEKVYKQIEDINFKKNRLLDFLINETIFLKKLIG